MTRGHPSKDVARAISRFFAVRGLVRRTLARGKRLDPSAWLHIETLKFIADRDRPRQKDLATYLSITAPSATSLVANLVKQGLVVRKSDERDKRALRLALSPKGERTLKAALRRGARLLEQLFAALSERELTAFTRSLERLLEAGK